MSIRLAATDKLQVSRLVGVNTFMKLPLIENVDDIEETDVDYAVVGIPDDSGAGMRVGQRFAPNKIREMSAMLRAINMRIGTNISRDLKGFDNGDVPCVTCADKLTEYNQNLATEKVRKLVKRNIVPICMGGDHSITLGPVRAVGQELGPVGLIHFDSHVDTYQEGFLGSKYNNGTTITRGIEEGVIDPHRTISIGIKGTLFDEQYAGASSEKYGIEVISMEEFENIGIEKTVQRIRSRIGDGPAYLTFDMDCLDPSVAPGGGVYELGGFNTREIIHILQGIKDLNIRGFDVAEVCPQYDVGDITSYTAAEFMHMFIAMIGVQKKLKDENR